MMTISAKARFRLALAAFLVWIGYLAFLAFTTRDPVVLSRPQLLASEIDVIAEIDDRTGGKAKVVEVIGPEGLGKLAGQPIVVHDLVDAAGWDGAGEYILPLVREGDVYRLAVIPRSPGFDPLLASRPRIYKATPEARRQLQEMRKQ